LRNALKNWPGHPDPDHRARPKWSRHPQLDRPFHCHKRWRSPANRPVLHLRLSTGSGVGSAAVPAQKPQAILPTPAPTQYSSRTRSIQPRPRRLPLQVASYGPSPLRKKVPIAAWFWRWLPAGLGLVAIAAILAVVFLVILAPKKQPGQLSAPHPCQKLPPHSHPLQKRPPPPPCFQRNPDSGPHRPAGSQPTARLR